METGETSENGAQMWKCFRPHAILTTRQSFAITGYRIVQRQFSQRRSQKEVHIEGYQQILYYDPMV